MSINTLPQARRKRVFLCPKPQPYASSAHPLKEYAPLIPLPETGFLRLPQILGDPKAQPPIPPIFPVGKSTWWAGVKAGRYPQPVKLSPRCTAWRVEDIRALIEKDGL